jgi:histone H3/H4
MYHYQKGGSMAYLYGASIQGIQGFIFETNRLREIVGASDSVELICTLEFLNMFCKNDSCIKIETEDILRNAGGNIRIRFDDKNSLQEFVKYYPQKVMKEAYGITISQAVVEYDDDDDYLNKVDELERSLQASRNKASYPLDAKFALMRQSNRTGKPANMKKFKEYYDKASFQKLGSDATGLHEMLLYKMKQKDKDHTNNFTLDMDDIANGKNKIAIVHADGNNMGIKLQSMKQELMNSKADTNTIQEAYKVLSTQISKATNQAIKDAFETVFKDDIKASVEDENKKIPFRPCIIGGDDVTVICNADKAMDFTKKYLELFEKYTKEHFKVLDEYGIEMFKDGLTACAGIAYCNKKFPFHYAVNLAEVLCGRAKEASGREASCLQFHNIQGSAFVDYQQYVENELTLNEGSDAVYLEFGPYYVHENNSKPTIDALLNLYAIMGKEKFPLGKLREWLGELAKDTHYAGKFMERFVTIAKKDKNIDTNALANALSALSSDLSLDNLIDNNRKTPIHDILQLKSVQGDN